MKFFIASGVLGFWGFGVLGVLEERIVKLGLETAMAAEIISGIGENDLVVLGSRSQLQSGQSVETKIVQALKPK